LTLESQDLVLLRTPGLSGSFWENLTGAFIYHDCIPENAEILCGIQIELPVSNSKKLWMILPLLDYSDIVWGDKHNKTLMA